MAQAKAIRESIKIPSSTRHISAVSSKIVRLLLERNADKSHIFDIRLAAEEAVLNAIEHGNKRNERLSVDISFVIDDEKAEITVEDKGKGFNHAEIPDPTTDENILRSHGRGVYLIKKLMDKVEYNGAGNRVKLTKRLR